MDVGTKNYVEKEKEEKREEEYFVSVVRIQKSIEFKVSFNA
jgi:hypothetical protein